MGLTGGETGGGKGLNPRLWLKAATPAQPKEGKRSGEAAVLGQENLTHAQPPASAAGRRESDCACARTTATRGPEQRGQSWESRGPPGSRPAPPQPPLPSPPLSRRDARSRPELRRAAGGECPRGARVAQTGEGVGWGAGRRNVLWGPRDKMAAGTPLHPLPSPGIRAERGSDRRWGRGAAASREGRGFLIGGLGATVGRLPACPAGSAGV